MQAGEILSFVAEVREEKFHITFKEAKVALSSPKRTCRVAGLHGKLKLTLTDNLSFLCAFEKGRWRLCHIETKQSNF